MLTRAVTALFLALRLLTNGTIKASQIGLHKHARFEVAGALGHKLISAAADVRRREIVKISTQHAACRLAVKSAAVVQYNSMLLE